MFFPGPIFQVETNILQKHLKRNTTQRLYRSISYDRLLRVRRSCSKDLLTVEYIYIYTH